MIKLTPLAVLASILFLAACPTDPAGHGGRDAPDSCFSSVEKLESTLLSLKQGDGVYTYRSGALRDLNGDGVPEVLLTISSYPANQQNPILVISGSGPVADIASSIFPGGVPSVGHSNQVFFRDLDGDGQEDLLLSEAGLDYDPWHDAETVAVIAMNRGGGVYEDVSAEIAAFQGVRAYALAAGDFDGDGIVSIFHPGQSEPYAPALLSWNGSVFTTETGWFDVNFWYGNKLIKTSNLAAHDLDGDGFDDLYFGGTFETWSHRVIFGGPDFPSPSQLAVLPDGPCGHTPWEEFSKPDVALARGSDVNQVLFEDFDGDGDLDIASFLEECLYYKAGVLKEGDFGATNELIAQGGALYCNGWFQVLLNIGGRAFVDVSGWHETQNLGYRYYVALLPVDLDLDGDLDIVGHYWTKTSLRPPPPHWGTTLFFNAGNATFTRIDATTAFGVPEDKLNSEDVVGVGAMFPTLIGSGEVGGLFIVPQAQGATIRAIRFRASGVFRPLP